MKQSTLSRQTFRYFLKHLKNEKLLVFLLFFGISVGILGDALVPLLFQRLIDNMGGNNSLSSSELKSFFLGFGFIYFFAMVGWRIGVYSISIVEPKIIAKIAKECFDAIHRQSYNFFNNEFGGSLVKRASRLMKSFETFLDMISFEVFAVALRLFNAVVVLFYVHPVFGSIMLFWSLLFVGFNYYFSIYKSEKYDLARAEADSLLTAQLADTIANSVNVKLFSAQDFERQSFAKTAENWRVKTLLSWMFSTHLEAVQSVLSLCLELGVLLLSITFWNRGVITTGEFILIHAFVTETVIFTWHLGRNLRRLFEAFADAEEMMKILLQKPEVKDRKDAKELIVKRGSVEFKSVHFSYKEGESILNHLNLKIKPSEKLGLIGPSGGGKTTVVKLLLRLFDIQKGQILIDSQDISRVTQDSLRQHVVLVPQDPILFHRSLMENIRYGRLDATDEEVLAAAKMAHCHEFILSFPKKYATLVGERGVKLSGGEKQRIAIARAMLSNAPILILDEATSNLDVHSEKLIQDALATLTRHKTTIVIAHRLSTIVNMDRILVIEGGKVMEEGKHASLLKQKGLYHSLWSVNKNSHSQTI